MLTHDVGDELVGYFLRRELTEFAQDARVAPAGILTGQLEDQFAASMRRRRPALPGFLPAFSSRSQR